MKTKTTLFPLFRPRWMVVDDDEIILSLLRHMLARVSNAKIYCFKSGEEALAAFKAAPRGFQLVLTDFKMPGMNGIELCREIRAISPNVKIGLMTGSDTISEEQASREGFCRMLRKPFAFDALCNAIADIQNSIAEKETDTAAVKVWELKETTPSLSSMFRSLKTA